MPNCCSPSHQRLRNQLGRSEHLASYDFLRDYDRWMSQIRTDSKVNAAEVAIAWIITVLTIGYMFPWAIAATRGKSNSLPIALLNFFAGWTLIGWIVALVMACGSHQVVGPAQHVAFAPPVHTAPNVWIDAATGHTLTTNPVTNQPVRIDPYTGQPWVEPAALPPS